MIEPRSEYDYGTAAIELAYYTPAPTPTLSLYTKALNKMRRMDKIERSHNAKPERIELTKALRWVWTRYPQHFSVMR